MVEIGIRPFADEAAVTFIERESFGKRRGEGLLDGLGAASRRLAMSAGSSGRPSAPLARERAPSACVTLSASRTRAEIAWTAVAPTKAARERGQDRARCFRPRAVSGGAAARRRDRRRHRARALSAASSVRGLPSLRGKLARAGGGDGAIDGGEQASRARAPWLERISSRLARVAASMRSRLPARSFRGGRSRGALPTCVSST